MKTISMMMMMMMVTMMMCVAGVIWIVWQESTVASKRRVHFLDFMLDVHQRMHRCRQRGVSGEAMVSTVTDEILEDGWLLCFDEMQVG